MPITVASKDSGLTITLSGEIDHHAARELMAQGGFYAQLYQSQFKGEAETP